MEFKYYITTEVKTTLQEILKWSDDHNRGNIVFEENDLEIRIEFHYDFKTIIIDDGDDGYLLYKIEHIGMGKNTDYEAIAKMVEKIVRGEKDE